MHKIDQYGCYVWIEFQYIAEIGERIKVLMSAPMYNDGKINPQECGLVSRAAFTEEELVEYITVVSQAFEEPRETILKWICE